MTHTSSQNGILIAINKDIEGLNLKDIENYQPNKISAIMNSMEAEKPTFLQVEIKVNNKPLTIIGTRIRIDNGNEKDLKARKDQLQALSQYVKDIETAVLIMGDFNNGMYKQPNWNWDLIENSFDEDYKIHTPIKGFSWKKNGYKNGFKNDHIIAKGLKITDPQYSWEFMKSDKEAYNHGENFNPKVGYPDHAILIADFNLD